MTGCGACNNYLCSMYGCQKYRYQQPSYMPPAYYPLPPMGCICPPTSEKTCENPACPRKARTATTGYLKIETPPNDP